MPPAAYDEDRPPWLNQSFMIPDALAGNACGVLLDVTAVLVSALIIFFVYTALRDEPLPELLFSPQKRAFKALKESEREKARDRAKKAAARSHRKIKAGSIAGQAEPVRKAFARLFMCRGTRPVFLRCAPSPTRSTCSIPTGCTS